MSWQRWEAKAADVPGGRITRSLRKGFAGLSKAEQRKLAGNRADALDRLRAAAGAAKTEAEREQIWALVSAVGTGEDQPSWEQLVGCQKLRDFLSLAMRAEGSSDYDNPSDAQCSSELRTVRESITGYLRFKNEDEFSAHTQKNSKTVLLRAVEAPDPKYAGDENRTFGDRLVAHITRTDGDALVPSLSTIAQPKTNTLDDYRKHLHAWYSWELTREEERAEEQGRAPLFTANPFTKRESRYSSPNRRRHQTVAEQTDGRRFFPNEIDEIFAAADIRTETAYRMSYRLGLRSGELIHLRWLKDVRPLKNGNGYIIDIQGGESRGMDSRCGCPACRSAKGWAPKNDTRSYHLDRTYDRIGWITALCDALDRWVAMLNPAPGDFLFPSPIDNGRAWTDQNLNARLHAIARKLREDGTLPTLETGIKSERRLTMHSWRHSCASRMLEIGVPMPLAAEWIGDSLETFKRVYARPEAADIAFATLAGYGRAEASD